MALHAKKNTLFIAAVLSLALGIAGCKQGPPAPGDEKSAGRKGAPGTGQSLLTGKHLVKTGFLTLRTGDVDRIRTGIRELVDEYSARVLEENLNIRDDSRRVYTCTLKVRAENFSVLMDRLSALGELAGLRVAARDIGDELGEAEDRIALLKSRLNESRRGKDARLTDDLRARLAEAEKGRADTGRKTLYSYIYLTVNESARLSHAFALGLRYGREGMIFMVKAVIIAAIASLPLLVFYVLLKFLRVFFRRRWKSLLAAVERAGERPLFTKKRGD